MKIKLFAFLSVIVFVLLGCGGDSSKTTVDNSLLPKVELQPTDFFAKQGEEAVYNVSVSSPSPLSYQWYKNGLILSGENKSKLIIKKTAKIDDASKYYVKLTNLNGSITSDEVYLFVGEIIPDQYRSSLYAQIYGMETIRDASNLALVPLNQKTRFWKGYNCGESIHPNAFSAKYNGKSINNDDDLTNFNYLLNNKHEFNINFTNCHVGTQLGVVTGSSKVIYEVVLNNPTKIIVKTTSTSTNLQVLVQDFGLITNYGISVILNGTITTVETRSIQSDGTILIESARTLLPGFTMKNSLSGKLITYKSGSFIEKTNFSVQENVDLIQLSGLHTSIVLPVAVSYFSDFTKKITHKVEKNNIDYTVNNTQYNLNGYQFYDSTSEGNGEHLSIIKKDKSPVAMLKTLDIESSSIYKDFDLLF